MFDPYSKSLFEGFPGFEGLVRDDLRRALSSAYLAIIERKINGENQDPDKVPPFLRQIANTLLFHAILNSKLHESERKSAAFVAAEALALLAEYLNLNRDSEVSVSESPLKEPERFIRVECALLYLYSEYDSCASGVLHEAPNVTSTHGTAAEVSTSWALERLERLCLLKYYPKLAAVFPYENYSAELLSPAKLEDDTVGRLFVELGTISSDYLDWLVGERSEIGPIFAKLKSLLESLSPTQSKEHPFSIGQEYSLVFHLATLLDLCLPALGKRSLLHTVPIPPDSTEEYRNYLVKRAKGNSSISGRPVLWPSAHAYVLECIVGKTKHAVASMPTGSGKSFVAEISVSQSLQNGWVLYLAPTNALTEQIRGDLRVGLQQLKTEIVAFIGDREYSVFSNDRVDEMPANSVAVMTPEKCSLALRLSPEAFSNCTLVVFDECHLIGDQGSSRGPLAELVMAQLMVRAPDCKFLLMSAIVENPEDLAAWLQNATGGQSSAIPIRWRPTRTLRAVLGIDNTSIQSQAKSAIQTLRSRRENIKRCSFRAQCAFAVNLQGAWQSEDAIDYSVNTVNYEAPLKVVRAKRGRQWKYKWEGSSWVNQSAIGLGELLVESGIQTLIFTPSNKHYPFQNGSKLELSEALIDGLPETPELVDVCRSLSEYELGCESQVFSLLKGGVSVHTSLMLDTEKIATELAFKHKCAPVMFATGTLAQGLNLPAVAVVIAGSRIGDPRGQNPQEVQRKKFSQLLNAAGRAGRAGFANQGLVVAIPDEPVALKDIESLKEARDQVDYLQHSDNAVFVGSDLSVFLDTVCRNALSPNSASDSELLATSLLAGGDENQIEPTAVLRKTYASYFRKKDALDEVTKENADNLISVGTTFIEETGAPKWITIASQRAGLDFFLTLAISQAWAKVRKELPPELAEWSVEDWTTELLRVIPHIPPALLQGHFPADKIQHVSKMFAKIVKDHRATLEVRRIDWDVPENWIEAWMSAEVPLKAWMSGESFAAIASLMTGEDIANIASTRGAGKPVPKALALSQEIWASLALIAGGFLAVAEQIVDTIPLPLASLPMCIKYGCDSPGSLAWFRFGLRLRRPSRALAEKFPPPDLKSDEELREWVLLSRKEWLNSEEGDDEVLEACRSFLKRNE